jgi:hypothetical protein
MVSKTEDSRGRETSGSRRADWITAAAVALSALAVYLYTIYPGLTLIGDATKFAFVGPVLGTPHEPGYPLYVWTSHFFSYLPIGTLVYRMNLLAALWGTLAVTLCYFVTRHLGVRRSIAAPMALALAFGNAFWRSSLYAKGTYVLSATLVLGGMLALLTWRETGRRRYLLIAIAVFSLSLGNHLTVLALLPALVLFTLVTNPRQAFDPGTIFIAILAPVLSFAQYLFIIMRTLQGAPYLEARAHNLRELWSVMTARRFSLEVGAFSWSTLWSTRVPVIGRLLDNELLWLGIVCVAFGFVLLLRHRWRVGMLFGLGALGIALLTANMSSGEDQGFLVTVFALLWPVAGVGLDGAARIGAQIAPRVAPIVAVLVAIAVPVSQLTRNFAANNHRGYLTESRYFDTLFDLLPSRTAIVDDEYRYNMIVTYKLYGEAIAAQRPMVLARHDPLSLRRLQDNGFIVIAMNDGRSKLEELGALFKPYEPPGATAEQRRILQGHLLYQMVWLPVCMDVGNLGWKDLTPALARGAMSVWVDNYRPFNSTITAYSASSAPVTPVSMSQRGFGTPVMQYETYDLHDVQARARLNARAQADGATLWPAGRATYVTRTEITINDQGQNAQIGLDLGTATSAIIGQVRTDADGAKRGRVCSHALARVDSWPAETLRVSFDPDSSDVEFGSGWSNPERRPDGVKYRWTSDHSVVIATIARPRNAVVRIVGEPFKYPGRRSSISLVVNGRRYPARPLPDDLSTMEWTVPASDWHAGLNQLAFDVDGAKRPAELKVSGDERLLGVSVRKIELEAAR